MPELTAEQQAFWLRKALEEVKALVVGERHPNWSNDFRVTDTRGRIADLCDTALGNPVEIPE